MANDTNTGKLVSESKGGDPTSKLVRRAKKNIESAKQSAGRTGNDDAEVARQEELTAKFKEQEIIAQLEKLYSPESWAPIVSAPANFALMRTGNKIWELDRKTEAEPMANAASVASKYWLAVDPKWVALAMLGITMMTIYGTKMALIAREKSDKEKESK